MKKKFTPCLVLSRESLDAAVAQVATLKIQYAAARADMELEIARVQESHQAALLALSQQIEAAEAGVFIYCQQNRAELFPDKKSIDFLLAVVGFRLNPPSVEKRSKKDTWSAVATRLASLPWGAPYVVDPPPEVNKRALLTDQANLTSEQMAAAGLRFEQDEEFFITPKSEVASATSMAQSIA